MNGVCWLRCMNMEQRCDEGHVWRVALACLSLSFIRPSEVTDRQRSKLKLFFELPAATVVIPTTTCTALVCPGALVIVYYVVECCGCANRTVLC